AADAIDRAQLDQRHAAAGLLIDDGDGEVLLALVRTGAGQGRPQQQRGAHEQVSCDSVRAASPAAAGSPSSIRSAGVQGKGKSASAARVGTAATAVCKLVRSACAIRCTTSAGRSPKR